MKTKGLAVLLLLGLLTGCSPEAGRQRGGGPGADTGNHPAEFQPASKAFSDHAPSGVAADQLMNFSSNEGR